MLRLSVTTFPVALVFLFSCAITALSEECPHGVCTSAVDVSLLQVHPSRVEKRSAEDAEENSKPQTQEEDEEPRRSNIDRIKDLQRQLDMLQAKVDSLKEPREPADDKHDQDNEAAEGEVDEGEVDQYSISPALPDGLEFDTGTGVVSGTPSAVAESRTYEVVAKNSTDSTSFEVTFEVKVFPPEEFQYPGSCLRYRLGKEVALSPKFVGVADSFGVEPPLPNGMVLDATSGIISGVPETLSEETSYTVTVSNDAGSAAEELKFAIVSPPPTGLSYPSVIDTYIIGEDILLEPEVMFEVEGGACNDFTVSPGLPDGMKLEKWTGVITGAPTTVCDPVVYNVTAKNFEGSISTNIEFGCSEYQEPEVDEVFAAQIDEITEIAELMEEPSQATHLGDWMIWMVHRVYLNDPTLDELDFANKTMPYPYVEKRIAPKLMEALASNTNLKFLLLSNSNMQKQQGHQLAEALKVNTTLQTLNIETNNLDSDSIRVVAQALFENTDNVVEEWKFNYQKGVGGAFGRPVEEMVGQLMDKNLNITKLGFSCNDAHWRNSIDRALLRNNDRARKLRAKKTPQELMDEVAAEDRTLSRLILVTAPDVAVGDIFAADDTNLNVVRGYVADAKKLPTSAQLQAYAKNQGSPLKYNVVAPLIKDIRAKMLDGAKGTQVTVADAFAVETVGVLRGWSEQNANWRLDVWPAADKRLNFADNKDPVIEVSDAFAEWLRPA